MKKFIIFIVLLLTQKSYSGCFDWLFKKKKVKKIYIKPIVKEQLPDEVLKHMLENIVYLDDTTAEKMVFCLYENFKLLRVNKKYRRITETILKKIMKEKSINFKKFNNEPIYIATKLMYQNAFDGNLESMLIFEDIIEFLRNKGLQLSNEKLLEIANSVL